MYSLFRRTLSFLMAVILCFSMLPVSALATDVVTEEETETVESTEAQETTAPADTTAPDTTDSADSTEPATTAATEETDAPEETTVPTETEVTRTLTVLTLPDKIKYQAGDAIDLTGLELYLETSEGESLVITADDGITVASGDTEVTGNITVTVEYDGLTAEFEIQVHPVYIVGEILQDSAGYPESAHNYPHSANITYPYTCEGAQYLKLTFSSSTQVENSYDKIYIYDGADTLLGTYTNTALANKTITVTGDTVKIKLTSDGSVSYYGFSLTSIYAYMDMVEHEPTDEGVYVDPLCYVDGYTNHICWICGEHFVEPDTGSAGHVYDNGFCTGCGIPENSVSSGQLTDTLLWALTEDNILYVSGTGNIPDYLSWDITGITAAVIGEGVTRIGAEAFYGCSSLTSVSLPESLTAINDYAFYGCSSLTELDIPDAVAAIPSYAFYNCTALTEVSMPAGLCCIDSYAFQGCSSLTEIAFPETLTFIGNYAFGSCSALADVTLNEGLTHLGYNVFYGCESLAELRLPSTISTVANNGSSGPLAGSAITSVTFADGIPAVPAYLLGCAYTVTEVIFEDPADITAIGDHAFYNCEALESIQIPDAVTAIPAYAFNGCSSLTEILLPEGVTSIGDYAFAGCTGLTSITMPDAVTSLGYCVFSGCSGLTELRLPAVSTVGHSGNNGPLAGSSIAKVTFADGFTTLPDYILSNASCVREVVFEDPADITVLGNYAFYNCSSLESIAIPDAVTEIPANLFAGCSALSEVTLPASLTSIGNYAFQNCTSLTDVTLPEGLTSLDYCVFAGCSSLTELRLPAALDSVGCSGYNGPLAGSSITKVVFGDGLAAIPASILSNASLVKEVVFEDPADVTSLGSYAFYNCSSLESIALPDGITAIPVYCFSGCTALSEAVLPAGLKSIGYYAFQNCSALTALTLPEGITSLGYSVFYGCSGLTELRLPATLTSFGNSNARGPLDGSGITKVIFADGFTSVPAYALSSYTTSGTYASKVKEVVFEDASKITSMGNYAFQNCVALETFAVPEQVTSIPNYAFYYCTALKDLTMPESITSVGSYAFYSCSSLAEVNVPAGQTVGSYAYGYCTGLRTVTIGDGASIGSYAFRNCTNLNSVIIGDNVTLNSNAFYGVTLSGSCGEDLTYSLVVNSGVMTISGSGDMYDYSPEAPAPWSGLSSQITAINFASTVTGIGDYAFTGCTKLEYMYIPETIQTLGSNSFADCTSLTYVEIPDGVGFIGEEAFGACDNLSQAVFLGDAPTLEDNIFGSSPVQVFYPETSSGFIGRILDKFIEYIWTKWDDTIPSKDVVILLDVSGSMSGKTGTLSSASSQLIKSIGGSMKKTRISIVTYESSAYTRANFSTNTHALAKQVSSLSASGGTNYSNALNRAKSLLSSSDADIKFVIMFSDGQPGDSTSTINSIASGMRDSGIVMYSVGLGTNSTQRQVLINVAGSASRYFEASNIAGLIAAFEELSRNFGKSEYSTIEMKINDKRVDLFKESYTLCLAANDTISFYVTLGTNEMYDGVSSYALEQNGQYVIRNTTGDFTNLSAAQYFTAGSPVYLVLLDASGNVIERKELMLTFADSYTIRYLMGPDMDNELYQEETFVPGADIEPPTPPTRIGYNFAGWYGSENCEGIDFFSALKLLGSQKLTGNATVYAKWETQDTELNLGVDTWTFGNYSSEFNCTHYEMTTNDVERLKEDRSPGEQDLIDDWRFPTDENGNPSWGGSCFGMSSSVLLSKFGHMSIYQFPKNGTSGTRYTTIGKAELKDNTRGDDDVGAVESMINFYQLRQGLGSINTIRTTYDRHHNSSDSENLKRIIRKLRTENAPVLMTITLIKPSGSYGGHAVVAYDLEEFADRYSFKVYDCSQFGSRSNPIYYTVTVDVSGDTYTATCTEWTNAWARSGYDTIFFKTALTVDELMALKILVAPNTLSSQASNSGYGENKEYTLMTNYGDFTITDGTNQAVIENGLLVSGDLDIDCQGMVNDINAAPEYWFDLPILEDGNAYSITQTVAAGNRTAMINHQDADGFYVTHTAIGAGIITVGADGSIGSQYTGSVAQELKVTHNNLSTPWYTVKISGESTGFTLTPNGDSVTVVSAEETTVDVTAKSSFNNVTLNDVPVNSEESRVQESEDNCVVVQNNQIIAGEVYGYSVAFNSQMGTNVPTLTNVPYGSLIEEPTDPTKTGCIFEGWFIDEEYTQLWDFDTDVVTQDTVLYAGWSINPNYLKTVTFRLPGMDDQIVYVPKGELIPVEYAPVDENGEVMVWHTRSDFANDAWDFEYDTVSDDLVLYGKTALCTVSYEPNNYTSIADAKVYAGNLLTEPAVIRSGYTLCGWYSDAEFTDQWHFDTCRVAEDMTLYAKWVENIIDKEGRDTGISIEIVNEDSIAYTGKAVIPTIIVRDDGKILTHKTDYTVSYKNNTAACDKDDPNVKANKLPQITIQGKGNYKTSGKITKYFTIHPADMSDLQVTIPTVVTVKPGNKLQTLKPTVSTGLAKVNAKEYTVLYYTDEALTQSVSGITDPGVYYVVLEAVGSNVTGVSEAFKIMATTADKLLSKAKITPPKTITSTGETLSEDAAIQALIEKVVLNKVTWLTDEENLEQFKALFTVTAIDADGTSVSQADLGRVLNSVGKKTLTVTAREDNEEGLVGSVSLKITVKGAPLNKKQFIVSFGSINGKAVLKTTYTGSAQVPQVFTDLQEGVDYTVSYLSGKTTVPAYQIRNAGTYSLVVTGQGSYSGSITYKFTIDPLSLADAYNNGMITITSPGKAVYSPSGAVLRPTVSFQNSRQLTENVDYILKCSGNSKVTDKAAITLTGKGNFKGTLSKLPELTYSVVAKSLSASDISVTITNITYNGDTPTKVSFSVYDGGKKIPANQYTSDFFSNGNGGIFMEITGAEQNYTGSRLVSIPWKLIKANDKKQVQVSLPDGGKYYYTGESITPEVLITDGDGNDISQNFTITYGNNTNVGVGTVTVTGQTGTRYTGSVTVRFTILPKWLMWLFG